MRCFCISYQRKYGSGNQLVTGPIHAIHMRREREHIQASRYSVTSEILIILDTI